MEHDGGKEGNSEGLVLKPRKNKQFKKKRKRANWSLTEDATEEEVQANVLLLKEAQRLRNTSRRTGLPQGNKSRARNQDNNNDDNGVTNDVARGLGRAFATERSAHAEEERMARYVDEKMRERFGDTEPETLVVDSAKQYEDTLYGIPEHLRQESRPMYDPGEGLPASGVEEIELPDIVRKRNEIATEKAKQQLMARRATTSNMENRKLDIGGNMSVNFLQHRKEWNQNNVNSNSGHQETSSDKDQRVQGRAINREMATDAQAVERWRKRWRK